jgi:hypothetical protein
MPVVQRTSKKLLKIYFPDSSSSHGKLPDQNSGFFCPTFFAKGEGGKSDAWGITQARPKEVPKVLLGATPKLPAKQVFATLIESITKVGSNR